MLSSLEQSVIEAVQRLTAQHLKFELGSASEQNGLVDATMTVDATFDTCKPPVALEITSLTDHFEGAPPRAIRDFAQTVASRLRDVGLTPDWRIGLRPEVKLKNPELLTLAGELIDIMTSLGLGVLGPGLWSHDVPAELLSQALPLLSQRCDRASLLGIVLLQRGPAGQGVTVTTVRESSDSNSLIRPLKRALAENSAKMIEARRREYVTMLAVAAVRADALTYVGKKAPDFSVGIDHLWLFNVAADGAVVGAYYANRASRAWAWIAMSASHSPAAVESLRRERGA